MINLETNYMNCRGATLIEIMGVMMFLGILATSNSIGTKDQVSHQKVVHDIVMLEKALEAYKYDNGRYPTTSQQLRALVSKPELEPLPNNYRTGGYIKHLPVDPWQHKYILRSPGEFGSFEILSMGPDGLADTDDDICNYTLEQQKN